MIISTALLRLIRHCPTALQCLAYPSGIYDGMHNRNNCRFSDWLTFTYRDELPIASLLRLISPVHTIQGEHVMQKFQRTRPTFAGNTAQARDE